MASVAVEGRVSADQSEAGELEMVELGSKPIVHAMALFAARGKAAAYVVGMGRLKVLRVA